MMMQQVRDRVADWLDSKAGRAIADQAAAAEETVRLERRARVAADLATAQSAEVAALARAAAEQRPLDDDVQRLEAALVAARDRLSACAARQRETLFLASRRVDRLRDELRSLAPAALAALAAEMRELLPDCYVAARSVKAPNMNGAWVVAWSNGDSVRGRVDAIMAAIKAADALRDVALEGADLKDELDRLRAGLPAVDVEIPAEWANFLALPCGSSL